MRIVFSVVMIGAIGIVALSGCKKVKPKKVEDSVIEGSWKVTRFEEDGEDETYYFSDYMFDFKDGGTVTATSSNNTVSGTWSVQEDNSNDDSSSDVDFVLSFPATNNFDELSDDWDIDEQSDSKLELKDVSGGDGSVDRLTFEKM